MSGTTDRLALPYPGGSDGPDGADVPYWLQGLAEALDGAAIDDQGLLADRPVSTSGTPGVKGRYYFVKGDPDPDQNGILWRDNGTGWDHVGIAGLTAADVENAADKSSTSTQAFAGGITSDHPTEGVGYAAGAGGTVTQATSKATAVTLNKATGRITMHGAALAGGASVVFTLNNSALGADDLVIVNGTEGFAASGHYRIEVVWSLVFGATHTIGIRVTNLTGGSLSEALVIKFAIMKGAES